MAGCAGTPQREPILYSLQSRNPDKHIAQITALVPTDSAATLDMMMPLWTPGFYRMEDYAGKVQNLTAQTPSGTPLPITASGKNHWSIPTAGAARVVLTYDLLCSGRSVTTNWVSPNYAVINNGATFIVPATSAQQSSHPPHLPHPFEIRLQLASSWKRSITALPDAPDGLANHYTAPDYDTLVDSPIIAGNLRLHEFTVAGSTHILADVGDLGQWDGQAAAANLQKVVQANYQLWGFLPFKRYVYLNVFRMGGGGLEHLNSTLLTATPASDANAANSQRWLGFVSHEYFHAFNVKRLRPVELGPFDYEHPPTTASLWISEGLTNYYGELLVSRSGLGTPQDFLKAISGHITGLQNAPGRLHQTLADSSRDVWTAAGTSGVGQDTNNSVSYYTKGPVVGFLLDAKIQRATAGRKRLDDLMRLEYQRYSGPHGFTPEQFESAANEIAGIDLHDFFQPRPVLHR